MEQCGSDAFHGAVRLRSGSLQPSENKAVHLRSHQPWRTMRLLGSLRCWLHTADATSNGTRGTVRPSSPAGGSATQQLKPPSLPRRAHCMMLATLALLARGYLHRISSRCCRNHHNRRCMLELHGYQGSRGWASTGPRHQPQHQSNSVSSALNATATVTSKQASKQRRTL